MFTVPYSSHWDISQWSESPDDGFNFAGEGLGVWWHGHVSGNHYAMEGPLNTYVTPPEMYGFAEAGNRYYYFMSEYFYFDLINGGTEFSVEAYEVFDGRYFIEGDPTLHYDPIWDGMINRNYFNGTLLGTIQVIIDIKPGSDPNSINLGSGGLTPVAIISSADFDATNVDPDTVMLSGAGVEVRGKGRKCMAHVEDVNDDGLADLVVQVGTANLDPGSFQDGYAILTGETFDNVSFGGEDAINIVPPEK